MPVATDFHSSTGSMVLKLIMFAVVADGACAMLLPELYSIKYGIFFSIFAVAAATFLANLSLTIYPIYPLGFLTLALISILTLATGQSSGGGERISYFSAMFPMLLVGMAAFIPQRRQYLDFQKTLDFFNLTSLIFVICHVASQIVFIFWKFAPEDWFYMTIHENSFFSVFALCLVALQRRWKLFGMILLLVLASLAMRPSSTFMAGLAIGLTITVGFLMSRQGTTLAVCNALLLVLIIFPVVFITMPEFADLIYGIEPMIKEGLLGSTSNNSFRMVVLGLAREGILQTSFWIGQGFTGTTNVDVGLVIDGWQGGESNWTNPATASQAPVHSDFMIMLWQGGLLGYGIFVLSLYGAVRHLGRSLAITDRMPETAAVVVFRALYILIIVFSIFISFNPILQKTSFSYLFWFPLLICTLASREISAHQQ